MVTPMDQRFLAAYGPWAVVAGAGAGMGAAFARQLADRGLSVVLVDRDPSSIDDLAAELHDSHGSPCRALALDLGAADAAETIVDAVADIDVGLFVANAAASHVGPFRTQDPGTFDVQLRVNVLTPTTVIHRLLPRFARRERSGVILMSSLSSRRGAPLVATYAATKAYLANLAESLWDELRDDGVDVLGVLPGSTRTPGWLSSMPQTSVGTALLMDPDAVVTEALESLGGGQPTVVPGEANRESERFLDTMDRPDAVRMVGQVMRETYPDDRTTDPRI